MAKEAADIILLVMTTTILLPYSPLAEPLGLTPLPPLFLAAMLALVVMYAVSAELVKRWFYRAILG